MVWSIVGFLLSGVMIGCGMLCANSIILATILYLASGALWVISLSQATRSLFNFLRFTP